MDDFAAFANHQALLDFTGSLPNHDPRSNSYPPLIHHNPQTAWTALPLHSLEHETMSQHHHHHHHQQQQQQHSHGFAHDPSQPSYTSPSASASAQSQHQQYSGEEFQQRSSRPSSNHGTQAFTLHTHGLPDMDYASMMPSNWQYQLQQQADQQQRRQQQHAQSQAQQFGAHNASGLDMNVAFNTAAFAGQLQASPVDFMPASSADNFAVTAAMDGSNFMTMAGPMESMNALVFPLNDYQNEMTFPININSAFAHHASESAHSSVHGSSPTGTVLEIQSLSDNEGSWSMVNYHNHRQSFDSVGTVSNPSQNLHIRTNSDSSSSDGPSSVELSGSYEEIAPWPLHSPQDLHGQDYLDAQYLQHTQALSIQNQQQQQQQQQTSPPSLAVSPSGNALSYRSSGSSTTSPTSSGPTSPPLRRRKSPLGGKTTKPVIKKTTAPTGSRKDVVTEKKVGRRRGPLKPEQRQQAHEIRKLRACLRCKFLKKTCDKGEPCGGCRPSHARLWQVPCTRLDIKDIGYFMKDWKADYDRHVSLGFSVGNIKGFSTVERTLYITHGYGHYLPISAREVFVRDEQCFNIDWVETTNSVDPDEFEQSTARLTAGMEGVSTTLLSDYLDRHLDQAFEYFVDKYFEGTKFLTEMLKTAHSYYLKEKTPSIRKALKLVLAYNLTLHVTTVEGLSEDEQFSGRVSDERSRLLGKTIAPVMINFQIKCALADMWRELQKDILEELSSLYSSVYSGDKLKNWPTIFMLAAILLAIWEEMQFDSHYRTPDEKAVNKFCEEMETTPVGVIVGLFQAISTKLPGLQEWDTKKHHHLLGSNPSVCDALTEIKGHINKHEKYLKERQNATFDREDFDCLSNKFLSKLVIRAN